MVTKTILVVYDANAGLSIPDGRVAEVVTNVINDDILPLESLPRIVVGCTSLIDEFRIRHARGEIVLLLEFEGKRLEMAPNGQLKNWPRGFCDLPMAQLSELIHLQMAAHKASQAPK